MNKEQMVKEILGDDKLYSTILELIKNKEPKKSILEESLQEIKQNIATNCSNVNKEASNLKSAFIPILNGCDEDGDEQIVGTAKSDYVVEEWLKCNGSVITDNIQAYKTPEDAENSLNNLLMFNRLLRVRDYLRDGWKPDWGGINDYYSIEKTDNHSNVVVGSWGGYFPLFSFQNQERAERFLYLMKEDLERYYEVFV